MSAILEAPAAARTADPPIDEDDIRHFVGPRADFYVVYYRKKFLDPGPSLNFAWHWGAFLFPIPWLFYRRLHHIGIGLVLLPVLIGLMLPKGTTIPFLGIAFAVFCGLLAKRGYLDHAVRSIRRIDALGLPAELRAERIRRAGGISRVAAALSSAAWFGLAGLVLLR